MNYQYKVLHESDYKILEVDLNNLGSDGWKLANVVWDNDESLFIAMLEKEFK
jgi:hypothetical protein